MLHVLDVVIIAAYLLLMVAVGIASRGRQDHAGDYFTAGGGFSKFFGSVMVGLSIAATFFSGISFLAYPSLVYGQGSGILVGLLIMPFCWVVAGYWFVPRYLKLGGPHPYSIIERRFGYPTRAVAASMFVLLRVGWMGTLIYAPTVAIMAAFQLPDSWFWPIVLSIGASSTLYTTLGGIRGVIVTDAIQFVVMALGVLWPITHAWFRLPVSTGEAWAYLQESGRLRLLDTSTSFYQPLTVWSVLIGYIASNLAMYLADQMSLQRYLASENVVAARRAFGVNIVGVMIVISLFSGLGLAMAAWYGLTPGAEAPKNPDDVFPTFVATQLPAGAPGLIFAAILAATMSSMTSGINALAATLTLDFAARFRALSDPGRQLRFGRYASLFIGLASTAVAGVVGNLGTIFDIAQKLAGVFLGPLLACVVLAVVPSPVRPGPMIAGMALGSVVGWGVIRSGAYSLWVAPGAAAVSFAVPLVWSLLHPAPRRDPSGLADAGLVKAGRGVK